MCPNSLLDLPPKASEFWQTSLFEKLQSGFPSVLNEPPMIQERLAFIFVWPMGWHTSSTMQVYIKKETVDHS